MPRGYGWLPDDLPVAVVDRPLVPGRAHLGHCVGGRTGIDAVRVRIEGPVQLQSGCYGNWPSSVTRGRKSTNEVERFTPGNGGWRTEIGSCSDATTTPSYVVFIGVLRVQSVKPPRPSWGARKLH